MSGPTPSVDAKESEQLGPGASPHPDMVWIPGGTFAMGSDKHYPEERPVHRVTVDGFWMDRAPVTNERFAPLRRGDRTRDVRRDSAESGGLSRRAAAHALCGVARVRAAVRAGRHARLRQLVAVHARRRLAASVRTRQLERQVWTRTRSSTSRIVDADAFARWEGKTLPTEAEWEFAARGGLEGAAYAWGDEFLPDGRYMANTWQGEFPWQQRREGRLRTHVAGRRLPANGYGLHDMIGNVWEWTTDWYVPKHPRRSRQGVLHSAQPARASRGRQLRPLPAGHQDSAQGAEGRVAPVRAELLPPVSPGGAIPGAGGHLNLSRRLPLHRPAGTAGLAALH